MIPLDFGPKPIFPSKDAAKARNMPGYFFVGKISYYMVTPTTSLCDTDYGKVGRGGKCVQVAPETRHKTFFRPGHFGGLRNFCRSLFRPPSSDTESSRNYQCKSRQVTGSFLDPRTSKIHNSFLWG